jgi:hypothetical protein
MGNRTPKEQQVASSVQNLAKLVRTIWAVSFYNRWRYCGCLASIGAVAGIDFQNSYITATAETPTTIGDAVPAQYKDIAAMTQPGSMSHIMK